MMQKESVDKKQKPHSQYPIHTGQETDAIMRAASHGRTGENWRDDLQEGAYVFGMPALSHYVRLELTANDVRDGQDLEWLRNLREQQDSDSAIALLCISQQMLSVQATIDSPAKNAVIDIDEVIASIGFDPRSTVQRVEMRQRIWDLIQFGERAKIIGQRKGEYRDKSSGERIETFIETAPWRIMETERPEQLALYGEIPVRVELAASNEWMRLLSNPSTAQFLPYGEVLGAIPPAKPSGAWARVIGLSLANFWRRFPRETLEGTRYPLRRELLTHYPPRTGSIEEVLARPNIRYALQYWAGALELLVATGFLMHKGESLLTYEQMREAFGRQDWRDNWLNGTAELYPGTEMVETLKVIMRGLPEPKSRDLKSPRKRRR